MLYAVAGAVVLLLAAFWATVYFARKSEREKIHRYLEESAREASEEVNDILGEPLGTDAELLAALRPDGMPEADR